MIFSIPIFVEERPNPNGPPHFIVRPLFQAEPVHRAEKLSRALNKLSNDLQEQLTILGREPRHDLLAQWTFHPEFEETTASLRLELNSHSGVHPFFFVGYRSLDRQIYFTPTLPGLHFELLPGQALIERATDVLTRHFRAEEKEGVINLDDYSLKGKARLTTLEITLHPAALARKPKKSTRAFLFGRDEKMDGEEELRKTGRPLHQLYPDDLDRAVGRDLEVEELARLLSATDRRPILLVGRRKAGKTVLLHEVAWRISAKKKERYAGGRQIWLISPMRLISGMSYLGEWENRVLAILDYAREKDRVLYFDNLLGLFTAGMSAASDLNVAQVLKPAMEKRSVRVIAEITPEAWRVLQERDRSFADLFHVIPVPEPSEAETMRILVHAARRLEEQNRCLFDLAVIPVTYELHRRFRANEAFPGKAIAFLQRLGSLYPNDRILRTQVLVEFREQSGLQPAFFDEQQELSRAKILESLRAGLTGQPQALEAFADVLVTLKAGLNDPRRPLATFLLLGPTGVGKTQSAKALAQYVFGTSDRLLRFDMNEYVDSSSVARLAGTPADPEGLLTSVIRRQPFTVVLFDEIEKAAPEVFDLLLAVLDEGRLTDALGRVADFTNAIILLTSNLGVQEARSRLGFAHNDDISNDEIFVHAAEKFFRPEFFNRLDTVIPFRRLDAAQLENIAQRLIREVFERDGLRRRECSLDVSPEALARLVQLGNNPEFGARPLKRVIEREMTGLIAERLAAIPPGIPARIHFHIDSDQFAVHLQELRPVPRTILWPETVAQWGATASDKARIASLLEGAYDALDRIEADLENSAPTGPLQVGQLSPEQSRYYFCREQLKRVDRLVEAVKQSLEARRKSGAPSRISRAKPLKVILRQWSGDPRLGRLRAAVDLRLDLADFEESTDIPETPVTAMLRELALLETMVTKPGDDQPAILVFRPADEASIPRLCRLAKCYEEVFNQIWGASASGLLPMPKSGEERLLKQIFGEPGSEHVSYALFLTGINLRRIIPPTGGSVLVRHENGNLGLIHFELLSTTSRAEAESFGKALRMETSVTASSNSAPPVLHRMTRDLIQDFRTGIAVSAKPSTEEFRNLLLSSLPLPPELKL